ncbi:hypothetical protein AciM339_1508 [Aciduliprofundum sp. MAR08-339]|nr:hypothetical protein AciM339_1508 [Aciduliprofundum sp. MAR08-339]
MKICPKCGSDNVELVVVRIAGSEYMFYRCKDCGHSGFDFIEDGRDDEYY